jgi:hypothetical protein
MTLVKAALCYMFAKAIPIFALANGVFWPSHARAQMAIEAAQFFDPTNRYPHNVLGNLQGFGGLEASLDDGTRVNLVLPADRVFEDIAPRLWDIDADGVAEIVAVESDQRLGARLTAWTVTQDAGLSPRLTLRAAGDFIGTRFRWLAPIGVADFTGDGQPQIAYVAMPHLARELVVVALKGSQFVPIARLNGVSNHKIGQDFISSTMHACPNGPVIIVPSGDWQRVLRVTFTNDQLQATDLGPLRGDSIRAGAYGCHD